VTPAAAQHFKQMNGTLTQIAAGRNEVWGLKGSTVYRFNSSTMKFAKVSVPDESVLTQIAVGGGTLSQKDEVWGVSNGHVVFQYDFSTNKFVLQNTCGGSDCGAFEQIAVGPGYEDNCHPYEVWGLDTTSPPQTFTWRYNYCTSQFDSIPQPDDSYYYVSQIATGGGDVWAIDNYGEVWEYASPYWFGPGPAYGELTGFEQISVGVNDVWTVNSGSIWNWAPSTQAYIYGVTLGVLAIQTATGGDGVWVIYNASGANGLIARYDFQLGPNNGGLGSGYFSSPFSLTSPAVQIAVGSGAGVWAIDNQNRVYAFVRP